MISVRRCQYKAFITLLYVERDGRLGLITATKRLRSEKTLVINKSDFQYLFK